MPFSEPTKLEAKRKSHFRCVICREPLVEVHHIIPQKDGGSDELENAAPLCGGCHDRYGNNKEKRKQIREMRDFWWEHCEKQTTSQDVLSEKIDTLISDNKDTKKAVEEMKGILIETFQKRIENIKTSSTIPQVITASGISDTYATQLAENVYSSMVCKKCNTQIGLLVGTNRCPNCGEIINNRGPLGPFEY